jgi:hypothetical protein
MNLLNNYFNLENENLRILFLKCNTNMKKL